MEEWKKEVNEAVGRLRLQWEEVSAYLFSHPEMAFEERKSSAFLVEKLNAQGFSVISNIGGLNIAFVLTPEITKKAKVELERNRETWG